MAYRKNDWVKVTLPSHPAYGMVGEITDIGPGEYHVAVDETSTFYWFTEDDAAKGLEFYGRM